MSRDRVPPDHAASGAPTEALLRAALAPDTGCPDLAALAADDAGADDRLARHVASCARCRNLLAGLASRPRPLPEGVRGERLLSRARDIPTRPGPGLPRSEAPALLRIVVRAMDDALEILETSGTVLEAAAARGPADRAVGVERRVEGVALRAHLSYSPTSGFGILVDVQRDDADRGPLRVTLRRAGRDLRSEVAEDGTVLFPGVRPGRYRVDLGTRGGSLGHADLDLEA
ncbi:MAG: hypothetical protein ACQEXJ_11380 [Myxococcota bacterium]